MFRYVVFCLGLWYLFGCQQSSKKEPTQLNEEYYGFWLAEDYLNLLKETQSTREAQKLDHLIHIYDKQSFMELSFHEGASEDSLYMKNSTQGYVIRYLSSNVFNIEFEEEYLLFNNKKFIKAPLGQDFLGVHQLVNQTLLAGKYRFKDQQVEFKSNGSIIGLNSVPSYKLDLDYYDIAMNQDRIRLQLQDQKETDIFIYQFQSDTLEIYDIKCKEMEQDVCYVIEKGDLRYTFIRE